MNASATAHASPPPDAPSPLLPGVPNILLRPLAGVYGRIIGSRNSAYDRGRRSIARLPVPVVCVGNLSVGGTGKTPAVAWIVESLVEAGFHPVISLRGYRAGPDGRSDEAILHEETGRAAAVVVGRDRFRGVSEWLAAHDTPPGTCIVLDDGFQHRQLHRDFDLVVIDATRSPWRDALLPAGRLREPPASLARADGVLLTHAEAVPAETIAEIRREVASVLRPGAPVGVGRHVWRGVNLAATHEPVEWLSGRRVLTVCAIGNPEAFVRQARASGAEVVESIALRDHAPYDEATVARIIAAAQRTSADTILTTEKDWVKLRESAPLRQSGLIIARAKLALEPVEGESALLSAIRAAVGTREDGR